MAGPLAGISAAQIAQQKVQDQGANQAKQGPSKFDQAMKSQGTDKAQGVNGIDKAQHVNQAQKVDHARQVEQINKSEKAGMNKVAGSDNKQQAKALDPVSHKQDVSKTSNALMGMMGNMEKGQASLDKLINGAASGKTFSNAELLSLQAGMYKYSQELDLTSKVVEKATSGLKDTLKTQV